MNDSLSARDRERLSAYLDGALTEKEIRKLELRLATEPALASQLAQLERTRYLLRRAPQAQPPRAFTLTPQMAGERRAWFDRLPVSLTMVSAVASILLVFVLLGDFVSPGGIISYSQPQVAAVAAAESTAMDEEMETFALKAPEVSLEEAEADLAQEAPIEETQVLPAGADEDLGVQNDEDSGQRLIEEQVEQPPASIRRLHLFLVYAVLALVALVSGLGAWLQRRRD